MAKFRATAKEFARIAFPYFRGSDRWWGRGLLLVVIALQLFQVWLNVRFNAWYNTFYTALQNKNWDVFIYQFGVFAVLAVFFIVTAVYQLYLQQWLQIRWRGWLTEAYLAALARAKARITACGSRATRPTTRTSASPTTSSCSSTPRSISASRCSAPSSRWSPSW